MTKSNPGKRIRRNNGVTQRASDIEVCFELTRPSATAVFVAGTFNEWRPAATPMVPIADGRWIKQLRLSPGRYEYCLIVDGEWMPDPLAKESVVNPFGGLNSVLRVEAPN